MSNHKHNLEVQTTVLNLYSNKQEYLNVSTILTLWILYIPNACWCWLVKQKWKMYVYWITIYKVSGLTVLFPELLVWSSQRENLCLVWHNVWCHQRWIPKELGMYVRATLKQWYGSSYSFWVTLVTDAHKWNPRQSREGMSDGAEITCLHNYMIHPSSSFHFHSKPGPCRHSHFP